MMKSSTSRDAYAGLFTAFVLTQFFICGASAQAASIEGVWASSSSACASIFSKSKSGIVSFKEDSEAFGSGFIIERDRINGKFLSCKIIRRGQEKDLVHLLASCSSVALLDAMQFSLRMLEENKISRVFPGIPELEFKYERCSM